MGLQQMLALFLLVGWAPSGIACSLVFRGMGVELQEALRQSEEVFVARLSDYELEPPQDGGKYFVGKSRYELVEIIKGRPGAAGELVEGTPYPAVDGVPPGPACGPWVVTPQSQGNTYLIFASRFGQAGKLVPHSASLNLDVQNLDREEWLEFIRITQGNELTP